MGHKSDSDYLASDLKLLITNAMLKSDKQTKFYWLKDAVVFGNLFYGKASPSPS